MRVFILTTMILSIVHGAYGKSVEEHILISYNPVVTELKTTDLRRGQ